jgi:hypothetical protein
MQLYMPQLNISIGEGVFHIRDRFDYKFLDHRYTQWQIVDKQSYRGYYSIAVAVITFYPPT